LRKIFAHAEFSAVKNSETADDRFWVPILLLCTGARTSELYLKLEDVHIDDECPYLEIKENEARTLKTLGSERIIPLHPVLMQLGFGAYVERMKRQGEKWLFPQWKIPQHGTPSDSKRRQRFNSKILKEAGVKVDSVTAHCFRHNFETMMAEAGIPESLARRLTGRQTGGSADIYISNNLRPKSLREAICKIDFSDAFNDLVSNIHMQ